MKLPVLQILNRQFILPTNLGGYLNGLIFLLTLLAFGYNNNVLLLFTLVLFGMNLVWVIQSHLFFKKMHFQDISFSDAFLGAGNEVRIQWLNPSPAAQWDLELMAGKEKFQMKTLKAQGTNLIGEVSLPHRGVFQFSRLKISSPSPFGLYKNWIILPVKAQTYVYPALQKSFKFSTENPIPNDGGEERDPSSYQEFTELRSSEDNLSSRISWKHYARTDELLIKHGEGFKGSLRSLRILDHLKGEEREKMLSHLASEAFWCSQQGIEFELKGKSRNLGPGSGPALAKSVLRELAQC